MNFQTLCISREIELLTAAADDFCESIAKSRISYSIRLFHKVRFAV